MAYSGPGGCVWSVELLATILQPGGCVCSVVPILELLATILQPGGCVWSVELLATILQPGGCVWSVVLILELEQTLYNIQTIFQESDFYSEVLILLLYSP